MKNTKAERLAEYKAKRNFKKSPEPSAARQSRQSAKSAHAPIFCVQKHLASRLHYDFRLEHNGVLLSWAVPKGPSLRPGDKRLAMRVEDHPCDYAEFEGVIPEGYGAGVVMLWDRGTWESHNGDVDAAINKGELKFKLNGVKLKGSWVLVRTGGSEGQSRTWLLIKHRDELAGNVDITSFAPRSVKSDGNFEDIVAHNPKFWESHKASKGTSREAGDMLRKIVEKAIATSSKTKARTHSRATAGAAARKTSKSKL